jgi:hypothetical protein
VKDERRPLEIIGESKLRYRTMHDAFAAADTILQTAREAASARSRCKRRVDGGDDDGFKP